MKIQEITYQCLFSYGKCNVKGFIIVGNGDIKYDFVKNDFFDETLQTFLLKIIDIEESYHNGFYDAIKRYLASNYIGSLDELMQFYQEIGQKINKSVGGFEATMKAFDEDMIASLIIWKDIEWYRLTLKDNNGNHTFQYVHSDKIPKDNKVIDSKTGIICEIIDKTSIVSWLTERNMNKIFRLQIINRITKDET